MRKWDRQAFDRARAALESLQSDSEHDHEDDEDVLGDALEELEKRVLPEAPHVIAKEADGLAIAVGLCRHCDTEIVIGQGGIIAVVELAQQLDAFRAAHAYCPEWIWVRGLLEGVLRTLIDSRGQRTYGNLQTLATNAADAGVAPSQFLATQLTEALKVTAPRWVPGLPDYDPTLTHEQLLCKFPPTCPGSESSETGTSSPGGTTSSSAPSTAKPE